MMSAGRGGGEVCEIEKGRKNQILQAEKDFIFIFYLPCFVEGSVCVCML